MPAYTYNCRNCKNWGKHIFETKENQYVTKVGCLIIDRGNLQMGYSHYYPIHYHVREEILSCKEFKKERILYEKN